MHSFSLIIIIVGGNILLAAIGVFAARHALRKRQGVAHHQVAGYFLGVVGILYSLVLGLLVNNLQSKFDQAAASAQVEADSCSDLWNFSRGFAQPERHQIRQCIEHFYAVAQTESWEQIAETGIDGPGKAAYQEIWQNLMNYQPQGDKENSCYQSCLSAMQDLSDARSYRISFANHNLPPLVWWVMVIGGVLLIVFTYLFFVQSVATQLLITACVAGTIALNLFLVDTFEHPYRHNLHLQSQSFSFRPDVFEDNKPEFTSQEK